MSLACGTKDMNSERREDVEGPRDFKYRGFLVGRLCQMSRLEECGVLLCMFHVAYCLVFPALFQLLL